MYVHAVCCAEVRGKPSSDPQSAIDNPQYTVQFSAKVHSAIPHKNVSNLCQVPYVHTRMCMSVSVCVCGVCGVCVCVVCMCVCVYASLHTISTDNLHFRIILQVAIKGGDRDRGMLNQHKQG